jgi:hypothetical protein
MEFLQQGVCYMCSFPKLSGFLVVYVRGSKVHWYWELFSGQIYRKNIQISDSSTSWKIGSWPASLVSGHCSNCFYRTDLSGVILHDNDMSPILSWISPKYLELRKSCAWINNPQNFQRVLKFTNNAGTCNWTNLDILVISGVSCIVWYILESAKTYGTV